MRRATRNISLTLLLVLWPSSAFALLGVGDKAPPLFISDWVKGAPVDFPKDIGKKIYVVEFWATWCPPCKASVPRLTDFQKKYRKDVTIIGVTSLDSRGNTKSAVRRFVKENGAAMDYTVAIDKGEKTSDAYMLAAGVVTIPHSFIVGRKGNILWQGSPLDPELDTVLKQVVDGTYDIWPIGRRFPRLRGRIGVQAGRPIASDELLNDPPEVALERLRRAVETMRLGLRNRMREATAGRYPADTSGDAPYWEG